ncbi:MAG: TRAP transporter substrate-binding protein DctP [Desulfobacteraceae bacterium]|jgi:TRAP-type C4-dicarboxylate transport system substrate-binding protein|nr:TRAP transporter substrate-binding protein DctP [Desulfobacteraceae bacterium]
MKRIPWLIPALLAAVLLLGPTEQAGAVQHLWQVALEEIEGSMQHEYARKFVEIIERESQGKIRCEIHFYGDLGTSGEITELLQKGDLQFAFQSPGHLGSYIPEVQVFSIHYLFPTDFKLLEKILRKGPNTYKVLGKYYRKNKLELLSIIEEGWQIWTANKALRKPADFQNITFRVMSSPFLITAYRLYGAYVITVPYGDIYLNLEIGRIDAETQPFFAIQEMKFYEVQNYMIKANQLPFIGTFAANYAFIKELPPDIRSLIDAAVKGANEYIFDLEPKLNDDRRRMIMDAKPSMTYIELTDEEIAAFKEKAKPLREKFLKMGGEGAREVLDAVLKDIEWAKKN